MGRQRSGRAMKVLLKANTLPIPEGITVDIKARVVTVKGSRGTLKRSFKHMPIDLSFTEDKTAIRMERWFTSGKANASIRTCTSHITNMFIGVTKGFKYKMRYVYAHFPINVNLDKNKETGLYEVEIRNFLGEKLVRRVTMRPGVEVVASANQKDQIELSGNDLENVSQCAADIQQICRVRNKDIRKFLDGLYVSERGNIMEQV